MVKFPAVLSQRTLASGGSSSNRFGVARRGGGGSMFASNRKSRSSWKWLPAPRE
jgi:hypothetical protein